MSVLILILRPGHSALSWCNSKVIKILIISGYFNDRFFRIYMVGFWGRGDVLNGSGLLAVERVSGGK